MNNTEDIPNQRYLIDVFGEPMEAEGSQTTYEENERALLDSLIENSRLYQSGQAYENLLATACRLRNVAPFNAMLLDIQKPGVTHVASEFDWEERFNRGIKDDARPLVILRQFGPVAFVYDVLDTVDLENPNEETLPENLTTFFATGPIEKGDMEAFETKLRKAKIELTFIDQGDAKAGLISKKNTDSEYKYHIKINRNHSLPVQFSTLAHELAHLLLGHLGPDKDLQIPKRRSLSKAEAEIEAESTAYIACKRNGVDVSSQKYLSGYIEHGYEKERLDLYQVMRSAGRIESLLGLIKHTKFRGGKKNSATASEKPEATKSQTRKYRDFSLTVQRFDNGVTRCEITQITQLFLHERNVGARLENYVSEEKYSWLPVGDLKRWIKDSHDERPLDDITVEIYNVIVSWY